MNTELSDTNPFSAINVKDILVAAYPANVCKFNKGELKELEQVVKRELRSKQMLRKTGQRLETLPEERKWRKRI